MCVTFSSPWKELDLEGFDERFVAVVAFFVLVSIDDQFALDNDSATLFKILAAGLCGLPPALDVDETHLVLPVVVGNAEGGEDVATGHFLGLGICAQVPANNDVIQPQD